MWKSGSGRSLIRDGNAICMVMGTRGENCTPGFERSSSFREPIFSPLPRSDTSLNCLTVNCVSRPTGLKQIFPPFFQLGDSSERERLLTIVVCGEQFFVSFIFFFFFPSLRDKTTSISVESNTLGWRRDWNWNNSKTTCIPLIPLGGNQNGKFGNEIWRIMDEREREKRKRASRKNFLEGRERDAEWSNTTTIMKFPRKLINRDIRPLNSRVVSHLRTINYMMERWSIRESVQSPSKVKFFPPPFEAIAFDRTELDHRLLKSIRSNEFNLKSWTQAIQFESLFVPLRMTIPNINSKWYLIIFLLWNEDIFSFYCWFFKFRFFLFEKKKF